MKNILQRFSIVMGVAASILSIGTVGSFAETFPSKPVTIVVGAGAGGSMGRIAQQLADGLERKWGSPVLVDFRPGAGGLVATRSVALAEPDGHTLLYVDNGVATLGLLTKDADVDVTTDITPITKVVSQPYLALTNSLIPAKDIDSFVAYAKENPGEMNFATLGRNEMMLNIIHFSNLVDISMQQISYQSAGDIQGALLRNDVQFYFGGYNSMLSQIRDGSVVPLATLTDARLSALPDVPTAEERGIAMKASSWHGLFAPPGASAELAEQIASAVGEVLRNNESLMNNFKEQAITVVASTPDEFVSEIKTEVELKTNIARENDIHPE